MNTVVTPFWELFLQPLLRRPKRVQLAALCYRKQDSQTQVLLITSRGTGRWILPKGWPIDGTDSVGTALQEAWEEAGVRQGIADATALGTYTYQKNLATGWSVPVETIVYPVAVTEMQDKFPEASQRHREWFAPADAANLVNEPVLRQLLSSFAV
ncbi:MAG: NUDIX hydrolase [Pseudomonadota bacterium]